MKKSEVRKNLYLKKYFLLFTIAAIAIVIIPTVGLALTQQILNPHAVCLGDKLHISGPVQLSMDKVPVGGTIDATVTYTNNGQCDVYIRDMAIAGRPPGAPRIDSSNQYGKYAFLPEKFNFTLHPGQSQTMNGFLTIQQGWPQGSGWYSYAAWQDSDGNWHDRNNPDVYFIVGNGSSGSGFTPTTGTLGGTSAPGACASLFHGVCQTPNPSTNPHPYQCPQPNANGVYYNYGQLDCGSTKVCCNP